MSTQQDKINAIKETIWTHDEAPEPMSGNDIPRMIDKIAKQKHDKGFEKGKTVGEAQGREAQKADFWNLYQHPNDSSGGRNGNTRMFSGTGWNSTTFYPQYDINISSSGVFGYFDWWGEGLDLVERLNECGVKLDSSKGVGDSVFSYAWVKTVPKITVLTENGLSKLFQGAQILHTIEELALPEENNFSSDNWKYTFSKCNALKNIVITGMIANSIDFSACSELTSASVDSIIDALKQLSDGDGARTVTFHATVKANMTETQIAAIDEKGWTLA